MADTKRLTFDVGPDIDRILSEKADAKSTTKADILRRALASYAYLEDQQKQGKTISITENNVIEKDVVLP